jgi:hypothetical protein
MPIVGNGMIVCPPVDRIRCGVPGRVGAVKTWDWRWRESKRTMRREMGELRKRSKLPSRSIATVELLNSIIELTYCRRKRIRVVANFSAEGIVHLSHSIGQML